MEIAKTCFPSFWAEMWCFKSNCLDPRIVFFLDQYQLFLNILTCTYLEVKLTCYNACSTRCPSEGTILKQEGILHAWEIIFSAWERKIEFVQLCESHSQCVRLECSAVVEREYPQAFSSSHYEMFSCFITSGADRDGKVLLCYNASDVLWQCCEKWCYITVSTVDFERSIKQCMESVIPF